jgi:hypothetical protein
MDLPGIIKELRNELIMVEQALLSIERLAVGHEKRRGRPPKWLTLVAANGGVRSKSPARRSSRKK